MTNKFHTNEADDKLFLSGDSLKLTFGEFKELVLKNLERIKDKKDSVVILNDDILSFTVNFFASVFAQKTIYLPDEVIKLKNIDLEYDILDKIETEKNKSNLNFPKINENEIIINFLTSGSSGSPKIIKTTLKDLMVEAKITADDLNFEDVNYTVKTTTTLSHRYCLTYTLLVPLIKGYVISIDKLYYPDKEELNNSIIVSTPSFLEAVKNSGFKFLSAPKYILSAGSKLSDETFEYFEKEQIIINIYGCTETGVISYKRHSSEKTMTLFSGINIFPSEDGTIVNTTFSSGKDVKISDLIEVRGNKIILKSRADRLLKIQEKRISAESVENQLKESELVNDAFCFKKDDKIACLCALSNKGREFLLKEGTVELTKKLKQHSKNQSEIIPQKWKFIDILPVTKRGKTDSEFISHIFDINFSFPIVLERNLSKDKIKFKLYFYPNSNYYAGHFPSYPITPGVAQLYLASFLGSRYFDAELTDGQIKKVKFSNLIKAGEIVDLELTQTGSSVRYEYKKDDEMFSSGIFSCENILSGDK